ncbi:CoA transferase [Deinococcus soli (ex Cha et al. 2016)]|uniref:Formyl-CoA transferase n=2 Tax=Deinococcus soli (ex Cha et al. 2016) TaxID=1309411 RepID=A0ACC6KJT2_9DEIO|nr:CoA transferase [Deinococcus soli (ex Cha et al. 2016)]MDR6219888.1 formyl-CoA transferase [Deinococcus soli (ex Cha et al. 2016)]MDR6329854.1 formyl-CoA transferase [Deinococcus soli (ex Cha et al. 2016)]MDR6752795.1 formyl-CoA transferase [Deinococcus soli (ex Cha et al. 2016)]
MTPDLPLSGVRVADFTRVLTGPLCTMLLGDLGADVIKVEPPGGDDTRAWGPPFQTGPDGARESSYFLSVNRNKRSVTLDLKAGEGLEAARRLIAGSDVLVENFRPGTLERLGLGWDDLHATHPRLIYASITGFGLSGPYRDRAGYDVIAQGMGGLMSYNGEAGGEPLRVGVAVADVYSGALITQAILAALYARERSGRGARVDVNLLESVIALGSSQVGRYLATGEVPVPTGNDHRSIVPYGTFPCADGFVNIAVGNDALWRRFCAALDDADLGADARFATNEGRVTHRADLDTRLLPALARHTRADLMTRLEVAGVPCGPVNDLADVFRDPHVQARGVAVPVPHPNLGETTVTSPPWRFGGDALPVRRAPPTPGQHTAEILAELGFSADLSAAEPAPEPD